MTKHGTFTPGQFMQILAPVGKALASAIRGFSFADLNSILPFKGKQFAEYLRLVFIALMNDQLLLIQDRPKFQFSLQLGQHKTVLGLRRALDRSELKVIPWMAKIIKSKDFLVITKPAYMNFVAVTPKELGIEENFGIDEFYDRAKQKGFLLCPPELGIQLYMTPVSNLAGEHHYVAMEPIEIEAYEKTRRHDAQREKCIFKFSGTALEIHNRVDNTGFSPRSSFIFMTDQLI